MSIDINDSIDIFQKNCTEIIENTKKEISNLQIGNDHVGIVSNFVVKNSTSNKVKLGHIAKIVQKDNNTVQINVYNPSDNNSVLASLNSSSLGHAQKHNNYILITIPPLTIDFIKEQLQNLKINSIQKNINQTRDYRQRWHKTYNKNKKSIGEDIYKQNDAKIERITKQTIDSIQEIHNNYCKKVNRMFNL